MSRVLLPALGVALTIVVIGGVFGASDVGRTASTVIWFALAAVALGVVVVQSRRRDR